MRSVRERSGWANQLPLLRLATMSRPIPSVEAPERLALSAALPEGVESMLRETARRRPAAAPRIEVVAVSDPNDLLGYALPPDVGQGLDNVLRVTNVVHSVAKCGYFFVAAHPLKAHTGYLDDDAVLELLVCGEPASCPGRRPS